MEQQSKRNAERDPSVVVTKRKLKEVGRNSLNISGALRQQEKLCSATSGQSSGSKQEEVL